MGKYIYSKYMNLYLYLLLVYYCSMFLILLFKYIKYNNFINENIIFQKLKLKLK